MNKTDIVFGAEKAEDSSGFLLWQVTTLWQRRIKQSLDLLDLTHTQFVLLATAASLSQNGNIVTQIDIANQSETDRMMVSKVLRTLQSKGLIARREHRTDTRAKEITLTRKALDLVQKAVVAVEQTDREFFGVLRTERESFNESMRQLIKRGAERSIV